MSAPSHTQAAISSAAALIEALLSSGVDTGFGIPSIHNIALYEALRQQPRFHHWVVRHEQAAGFAADGFCRRSRKPAVVFASTGPGNLFTLVPLLEALQTDTQIILMGTNVASSLLGKACGALHETPQQLEIIRPLTRFAARITSPDQVPGVVRSALEADGPAFIEVPHDLLLATVDNIEKPASPAKAPAMPPQDSMNAAISQIQQGRKPVLIAGSGAASESAVASLRTLAEKLHAPVLTTTSGKGVFPEDHPLAMGCISRLGVAQELLLESDLMISVAARFTEFDTGRYSLKIPTQHLQISSRERAGTLPFLPAVRLIGNISEILNTLAEDCERREDWWDTKAAKTREKDKLDALSSEAYLALMLLRAALGRHDVVVNDQSIINYWASAFFPVFEPRTFLYPTGSGTLGYALPAAIGAACALQQQGSASRVVCMAGDGGFQYTAHELATLAHYNLPVKILVVNDNAYGIIGFLQRTMFGQVHEVALQNPDFCVLAEAFSIPAQRVSDFDGLRRHLPAWLNSSGPALLEWRTELKAPWEIGAINRPNLPAASSKMK